MTEQNIASETLLMDYAAGTLGEAETLLIATHLALKPTARRMVAELEAVAGALMNTVPTSTLASDCLEKVLSEILKPSPMPAPRPTPKGLPHPLAVYLDCDDLTQLRWTRVARGISYCEVRLRDRSNVKLHLMRIDPGGATPAHQHHDPEMTLVLNGAYRDAFGQFGQGDMAVVAGGAAHQPIACPQMGCICLTAGFTPAQMNTLMGRFFARFWGI